MSYRNNGYNDKSQITLWVTLGGFALIALFVGLKMAGNLSGEAQAKATEEARQFAAQAYPGATVACAGGDSDNDGYVTCTVFPTGDDKRAPFSIQCTSTYSMMQAGCKLTPAITNPQGQ